MGLPVRLQRLLERALATRRARIAVVAGATAVLALVLLGAPPAWEYSNSVPFCGETCHTMPPQYATYQVSPHARVPCVDCHIGRDLLITQFTRKSVHMRLIWATVFHTYHYPIRVETLRPARDTCLLCHFPEKFSDDSLRTRMHRADDEASTPYTIHLLMHTGGGSAREGLGRGIHWHVENLVEYVANDDLDQEIPWVRVTGTDGRVQEYTARGAKVDPASLDPERVREMDCMTCHNRISHQIPPPRLLVDQAIDRGDLPAELVSVRALVVQTLEATGAQDPDPDATFAGLAASLRARNPDPARAGLVDQAVATARRIVDENTFRDQELDWRTHPDNIGHRDWPGCFRCHDGRHVDVEGNAVRLECNLCHSIPLVARAGELEPMLPLATGLEPDSHKDTTWISRHHNLVDPSCAGCHTVANAGGTSDTSFCSNSQCHGVGWRFGGFDAPALASDLGIAQSAPAAAGMPPGAKPSTVGGGFDAVQAALSASCGACHGPRLAQRKLRLTDAEGILAGSERGPVVKAGDPAGSRIVQVLEEGHFADLSDADLSALEAWIRAGARGGGGGGAAAPGRTAAAAPAALDAGYDPHASGDVTKDGLPCVTCHAPQSAVLGTDHDGAVVPVGDVSAPCVTCHEPSPERAAYRMPAVAGVNPASGRCLACHDGSKARGPGRTSHPEGLLLTTAGLPFATPEITPYHGPDGEPVEGAAVGTIACVTCHDPHHWRHDADERPGAAEGTATTSFLRDLDAIRRYCEVCHGSDAARRLRSFHDAAGR